MSPSTATVRRSKRPSRRRPDGRVPLVRRYFGGPSVTARCSSPRFARVAYSRCRRAAARPASQLATRPSRCVRAPSCGSERFLGSLEIGFCRVRRYHPFRRVHRSRVHRYRPYRPFSPSSSPCSSLFSVITFLDPLGWARTAVFVVFVVFALFALFVFVVSVVPVVIALFRWIPKGYPEGTLGSVPLRLFTCLRRRHRRHRRCFRPFPSSSCSPSPSCPSFSPFSVVVVLALLALFVLHFCVFTSMSSPL
eukprot:scaffold5966_cov67-Phaeocystis_antarctica.AAC.6